jgi:YesN/AraC family two-component response regulator
MNYTVLIVDDSKLARMAVIKLLKSSYPDWPRVEAGSAADALSALDDDTPHIALVDFNMPVQDGLHVVKAIRERNPKMPIAVISANHQQEIIARTHALKATFLPKPLTEKALSEFLETAMRDLEGTAP